ncbi:MAG TPA: thioester dehydrase [Gammaproteobacteria bacterium]|nr:thioester dehydrase [Gammaproteobacteria bacterium]
MNGLPAILAQRRDATYSELDIAVRADNPWFEGHFPGQPILPGVVQIGWAVHFACALHGSSPEVRTLEQIKFRRPILPGAELCLRLTPQPDTGKLRFEYRDAAGSFSSGTLVFGTAP